MAKRRGRISKLPMPDRVELLRRGLLSASEIADLAGDVGTANYIEAKAEIEQLLDHDSPIVRYNALGTLAYEWGVSSRAPRILEMLLADPDPDCRRQAAGALGSLFRGTRHRAVLDVLARIARDDAEAKDLRAFAYTAALDVIGVSRSIQPNPLRLVIGPDELLALAEYFRAL